MLQSHTIVAGILRPGTNPLQSVRVPCAVDPLRVLQVVQALARLLRVGVGGTMHSALRHTTGALRSVVSRRGVVLGVRALYRLATMAEERLLTSSALVRVGLLSKTLLVARVVHRRVAVGLLGQLLLLLLLCTTVVMVRGGRRGCVRLLR